MIDYGQIRAVAKDILTKFGKNITLKREQDGGVYDPVTGTTSAGTTTTILGVGVILSYQRADIDGTNILMTDRKLYFSGADLKVGDIYNDYVVHHAERIDPDESGTILTIAQIRQ